MTNDDLEVFVFCYDLSKLHKNRNLE